MISKWIGQRIPIILGISILRVVSAVMMANIWMLIIRLFVLNVISVTRSRSLPGKDDFVDQYRNQPWT